jgi:hypothetical protein
MKLIHTKETSGAEHYFNPMYIKSVKIVHSEYNQDWCIVLNLDGHKDNTIDSTYTILCETKEIRDKKLAEIIAAMESI